ncbi:hypothetical protein A2290_04985 [candidate division WOR-1 bacterium RIFOXYB2_FULL_36_35]|uniref:Trypsin n=1 Tax=candidate division WOR-1 bacterium RIFOXYB2_FULL_36_35 TaxID=1802578 RepID=A0A1F4S1K3_UNCSA|nr:MAG: hypothetical protein A2290_04985 [candidate division WOR-1 bacterium RIFOXYB2_FULL_36_35]OGC19901.1 MAG: hypothetical protein A2282_04750 [candidate division WOR-1 bacterium RIFOXYA12_FULL_36_13]
MFVVIKHDVGNFSATFLSKPVEAIFKEETMDMLKCWLMNFLFFGVIVVSLVFVAAYKVNAQKEADVDVNVTEGCLRSESEDGKILEFPLKHTDVFAEISGFLANVEVKQYFKNPYKNKIEAVYVFPLPESAAVNEMVMTIGTRNIYGEIHRREVARQIYEQAKQQGKRTALLNQERPNIFTQSVANIQPGEEIVVTIRYIQPLKYDRGTYSYVFPMVVGPRYNPQSVTDAANISPPVLKPGRRSGHDISLSVKLDPGLAISNLHSKSHDIDRQMTKDCKTLISIKPQDSIPNKDFILEYQVAGALPKFSYLTHKSQQGGYVMLMLQPSFNSVNYNLQKKEIFFVVDCSGSMSGYPIQKVKEAMYHCIKGLSADDTFQIIRFSENASAFAPKPVPASYYHKEEALDYIQALNGEGGTMAIEGVKACLDAPKTKDRQRIVFFMTDGYIGNENEILEAIKEKKGDTRLFSFGVGSSTNRYLLEGMAKLGNGTAQYIRQDEPAEPIVKDMLSRVSKPYLTDVELSFSGVKVYDIQPDPLPDLYSAQPLIIFGRYDNSGSGSVTLKGKINGKSYQEKIKVDLPDWNFDNYSLASVWGREKIKSLMLAQIGGKKDDIKEEVIKLALEYKLMSQYTSFVAVDEEIPERSSDLLPQTVYIPVPMPEGVSFTGVFGSPKDYDGYYFSSTFQPQVNKSIPSSFIQEDLETKKVKRNEDESYQEQASGKYIIQIGEKDYQNFIKCLQEIENDKDGKVILKYLKDKDQRIVASAIKEGTTRLKLNALVPDLAYYLLNGNIDREYWAIRESAFGLYRLSVADPKMKEPIQMIFAEVIKKNYPKNVGKPSFDHEQVIHQTALRSLLGYKGEDVYPYAKNIWDKTKDNDLKVISAYLLLSRVNKYSYEVATKVLDDHRYSGAEYSDLRKASIRAIFRFNQNSNTFNYKVSLDYWLSYLKRESSWQVRKELAATLIHILGANNAQVKKALLSDPHPEVRGLAFFSMVKVKPNGNKD